MGPRSVDRGIDVGHGQPGGLRVASMGPRSVDRGIGKFMGLVVPLFAALQWGRDQLIAELRSVVAANLLHVLASMGPRSVDRGIRVTFRELVPPLPASMGPRSVDRGIDHLNDAWKALAAASMGPRSVDRGIAKAGAVGGWSSTRPERLAAGLLLRRPHIGARFPG